MSEKTVTLFIYLDKQDKFRWRCSSANNKILARSSKGYELEQDMVTDILKITNRHHDADLYKDKKGEWRWRYKDQSGSIVAIASEGYKNRGDCKKASDLLLDAEIGNGCN